MSDQIPPPRSRKRSIGSSTVASERTRCAELVGIAQAVGTTRALQDAARAITNGDSVETFKARLVASHGVSKRHL
jgi:hypothetical protein